MQQKIAVVNLGIAANIHNYLARVELPLGMRQLAGRNSAVVDQVVIGTGFLDNAAGKRKGGGRGQDRPVAAKAQPRCPGYIVEASCFQLEIIGAVRRANVIVIGTAVEREM